MGDLNLIRGIKNGNQKSLGKLIDKYYNYVFTIIHNIVGKVMVIEDIEEICADVFTSLWNSVDNIDSTRKELKPYIAAIARNKAKNRLKSMKGIDLPLDEEIIIIDSNDIENEVLHDELSNILNECISNLEEPDREIIIRYYFFYEKVKDIAEELNINESTIKTKLFRSREKLKNMIMERGFCDEGQY